MPRFRAFFEDLGVAPPFKLRDQARADEIQAGDSQAGDTEAQRAEAVQPRAEERPSGHDAEQ